jgi:osmotically-inducible protein OsmY
MRSRENWDQRYREGEAERYGDTDFSAAIGRDGGPRLGNEPKGYVRSDDRIREDVCDRLSERRDVDSHGIEVSVSNGEVTLSGSVPERGMKFRAGLISDSVHGVNEVHNQLRVAQAPG